MTSTWGISSVCTFSTMSTWMGMLLVLAVPLGCAKYDSRMATFERDEAINIAGMELKKYGYRIYDMDVEADAGNRTWEEYLQSTPDFTRQYGQELAKLEGRHYWAIYFSPRPKPDTLQGGGDAFVFVERESLSVLSVIRLK